LANISFIGGLEKDYKSINKSINKSRDYTKSKDFLNSFEFSSAKRQLLKEDQAQIFSVIE
jgi:hypothetical protein